MKPLPTEASGQTLLLISPTFHGYYRSIAAGFEQAGYTVRTYCYDAYDTMAKKLRNKLALEMPEQVGINRQQERTRWDTQRALEVVRSTRADRIVLIKADTLGPEFWQELKDRNIPTLLWLYDDLSRHHFSLDFLRDFGPVISYAESQTQELIAAGVDAYYVPNAYDPRLCTQHPVEAIRPEIVFVGSRYPNRVKLLTHLVGQGIPVRAYGRQWSHHPMDRLRTWEYTRAAVPAERDISLPEAYRVQAQAAAALNIHGLQAGLTMRTFEVPGNGGLQLIDRPDVDQFYNPGEEILVFTTEDELTELCQRVLADPAWGEKIRRAGQRRSEAEHTFAHRARDIHRWWS